jgi:[ribosomal protein S5]-alanine N-acetyltransferase
MKYLLEGEETTRLTFRLLVRDDFETWLDLFKEQEVAGFLGLGKIKDPREQCEFWFKRIQFRYDNDLGGMNVLIDKFSNEFIGQCGLLIQEVDGLTELEIGYSILPKHWNKGYATEAAKKCRDFAFENDFTDSLISITHVDNVKSQMVAMKNGMKVSKTTTYLDMPVKIYRIDKADWNQHVIR